MRQRTDVPLDTRWREAVDDTFALLHENARLMDRRTTLYRERAQLFREILNTSQGFVDRVKSHEQLK